MATHTTRASGRQEDTLLNLRNAQGDEDFRQRLQSDKDGLHKAKAAFAVRNEAQWLQHQGPLCKARIQDLVLAMGDAFNYPGFSQQLHFSACSGATYQQITDLFPHPRDPHVSVVAEGATLVVRPRTLSQKVLAIVRMKTI